MNFTGLQCTHFNFQFEIQFSSCELITCIAGQYASHAQLITIWRVYNIPTLQFSTGTPRNAQSKSYIYLILYCHLLEFQNNALWDTL